MLQFNNLVKCINISYIKIFELRFIVNIIKLYSNECCKYGKPLINWKKPFTISLFFWWEISCASVPVLGAENLRRVSELVSCRACSRVSVYHRMSAAILEILPAASQEYSSNARSSDRTPEYYPRCNARIWNCSQLPTFNKNLLQIFHSGWLIENSLPLRVSIYLLSCIVYLKFCI